MSSLLSQFIQCQRQREQENVKFLRSLNPDTSATLAEVLEHEAAEHWLDSRQLGYRIESALRFLSSGDWLSPVLRAKMPFILFQAHNRNEDSDLRQLVPPSGVRAGPLPNLSNTLGVSPFVATDYVARTVIKEIGRSILPNLTGRLEPILDVIVVYAMDAWKKRPRYRSAWEECVHSECVDPFFFLEALRILEGMRGEVFTPGQKEFRKDLLRHYSRTATVAKRKALWNLPSRSCGPQTKGIIEKRIFSERPRLLSCAA